MTSALENAGYQRGVARNDAVVKLLSDYEAMIERYPNNMWVNEWRRFTEVLRNVTDETVFGLGMHQNSNAINGSLAQQLVREWSPKLIKYGRIEDDQIDQLLNDVTEKRFDLFGRPKELTNILDSIVIRRIGLRNYEREVEEWLELSSVANARTTGATDIMPVTEMLKQVRQTYDRVYDLCTFKINSIRTERATAASISLAAVAAAIALFA